MPRIEIGKFFIQEKIPPCLYLINTVRVRVTTIINNLIRYSNFCLTWQRKISICIFQRAVVVHTLIRGSDFNDFAQNVGSERLKNIYHLHFIGPQQLFKSISDTWLKITTVFSRLDHCFSSCSKVILI